MYISLDQFVGVVFAMGRPGQDKKLIPTIIIKRHSFCVLYIFYTMLYFITIGPIVESLV
jgi:hypothetical protein